MRAVERLPSAAAREAAQVVGTLYLSMLMQVLVASVVELFSARETLRKVTVARFSSALALVYLVELVVYM